MYENIGIFPKISIIYEIHDPWTPEIVLIITV